MIARWVKRCIKPLIIVIILGLIWTAYIQWKIHSIEAMPLSSEPADVCIVLGAALLFWELHSGMIDQAQL